MDVELGSRSNTVKQHRNKHGTAEPMRAISRAGRWSWVLLAGWIVLLLSCTATLKQTRDSRAQRRSSGTKVELDSHSRMACLAAELYSNTETNTGQQSPEEIERN